MKLNLFKAVIGGILVSMAVFLFSGGVYADTLKPGHGITAVEVFPDRAIVKRSAEVTFDKEGAFDVEITPLPFDLDEGSVRVGAEGSASAKISGVELKKTFLKKYDNEKIKSLKKELEGLKKDMALVDARLRNQDAAKRFLDEIKLKTHDNITRDVERGKVSVTDWQSVLDFYVRALNKADEEISELGVKRKELNEKIADIEKELRSASDVSGKGQRSAVISFEVKKPGELKIELSYMIGNAGWSPSYDVRALTGNNVVEVTSYGDVWQTTGEDWRDVSITLSTARPSVGAGAPELMPWYLSPPVYLERRSKPKVRGLGGMLEKEAPQLSQEEAKEDYVEARAEPMTADIAEGFTATTFRIKKKAGILSDGNAVRTTISIDKLDAVFKHKAVPKLMQFAYLEGEMQDTAGYPFLAGRANAFMEDNFVGTFNMKTVMPEEKFDLSLGIDEGVKAERKLVKSERGKRGMLSSKKRSLYLYEIEVSNFKKTDVEITVLDQLPVSQDKEINVGVDELTPEPAERTEQGILKWKLSLKPGEKKKIRLGFHADYPGSMPDPL